MNDYFEGSIKQLIDRCTELKSVIKRDLEVEFHALMVACQRELDSYSAQLEHLLNDELMQRPENQPERLRSLRRLVLDIEEVETSGIAALTREDRTMDLMLTRMMDHIKHEINYPLLPPTVTTLSPAHFDINHGLNLLRIPLIEGNYLLHLPDLYHELGHPLLYVKNDRRVEPFQKAFNCAADDIFMYFESLKAKLDRLDAPQRTRLYAEAWFQNWLKWWLDEFFCDLFAVYTIGPAFAWAHLHLAIKRGGDAFRTVKGGVERHPADGARMQAMLTGLRLTGFQDQAAAIEAKWSEFLIIVGDKTHPDYCFCYPKAALDSIAQKVLAATQEIDCVIAASKNDKPIKPIYRLLNQAWQQFWMNPQAFAKWERDVMIQVQQNFAN